ncbi:MAG: hypothetical protein LBH16_01180 [Treponema sp.]|jgi:hypothetical protein|nr:hypothetical protein [Treponema sp.]
MKIKLLMMNLFITFVLPLAIKAQEAVEEVLPAGTVPPDVTAAPGVATSAPAMPPVSGGNISLYINKGIGLLSQIGNIFGSATGFRIGGTTGTAIATLVIAKLVEDKAPSWVKYALYATGGTMFAGGGANIAQLITKGMNF